MRLMGAESGDTIATSRPAEIILPNPMLMSFTCPAPSFDVLDLLPDLLDFSLDIHHISGDLDVAALRADGVGLPVELLDQKVQLEYFQTP